MVRVVNIYENTLYRRMNKLITIGKYIKAATLDEAYELLQVKNAHVFGGGAFIKMGKKRISTAIDLSKLNLNYIEDREDHFALGGMTTFYDVESSTLLKDEYGSFMRDSVKDLIGVQLRNMVTYGATAASRYGFSDPNTALLALGGTVKFHNAGIIPIEDYFDHGIDAKDILTEITIPKSFDFLSFKAFRNSKGDYAMLNCAVSKKSGSFRIVVGARPNRSKLATEAMKFINSSALNPENIEKAAIIASEELTFGSNSRASADYRRELCKVLVKRALMEVL